MLWVNEEVEAEQLRVESPDVTAAVVRLEERVVVVASVYVPGGERHALRSICDDLRRIVLDVRQRADRLVDVLWGGDEILMVRQGEADAIIDLMNEFSLSMVKCAIHETEYGSDYRAIETIFDILMPEPAPRERLLFKNAPWREINARITSTLETTLC
ncbi:transposon i [Colletotrichum incanum]|uniref:Transposon i n=1 Tax=Colletotrichum incanum TaxID=1573173 RepID=A0A166LBR4_COLIC|nr:transposon i [Colletotrichum incanum]